jgi:tetratricopeptide (TPR) repeat protein
MDDDVDDDDGSSSLPLPTRLESRLEDITLPSLDSTAAIKWQRRRQRRNLQKQTQSLFERSLWMAQCWTEKGLKAASTAVTDQDWQRALDCWDNALEIYQTLTPNHTQVANVQNNRGIALGKLKRSNLALQALYQALQIRQLELQEVRTTSSLLVVVSTLHNIANVQQEVGNLSEALRVLVQAKHTLWNTNTTTKEAENNGHKDDCSDRSKWHQSARLCVAMGHLYYQAEHWKDAKEAYNDAQAVYQQLLADDDGLRNEVLIQELWNVKADLKEVEEAQLLDASSLEPSLQPVQQQLDQLSFIIEP